MLPIITLVGLDQLTKLLSILLLRNSITIFSGFLDLDLAQNTGISFGIFSNVDGEWQFYLLIAQIAITTAIFLYYLIRQKYLTKMAKYGLRFILAGGLSNLVDRVFYGAVVDMLDLSFLGIHLFTCNFADIYITFGLILSATFKHLKKQNPVDVRYKLQREEGL